MWKITLQVPYEDDYFPFHLDALAEDMSAGPLSWGAALGHYDAWPGVGLRDASREAMLSATAYGGSIFPSGTEIVWDEESGFTVTIPHPRGGAGFTGQATFSAFDAARLRGDLSYFAEFLREQAAPLVDAAIPDWKTQLELAAAPPSSPALRPIAGETLDEREERDGWANTAMRVDPRYDHDPDWQVQLVVTVDGAPLHTFDRRSNENVGRSRERSAATPVGSHQFGVRS